MVIRPRSFKSHESDVSQASGPVSLFKSRNPAALPQGARPTPSMMSHIGGAQMDPSGKSKGPPPAVKKVLSLFGSGREEDRMVGYLSFLKIGPKLLKFLPGARR